VLICILHWLKYDASNKRTIILTKYILEIVIREQPAPNVAT